jgi:hypothetical protein
MMITKTNKGLNGSIKGAAGNSRWPSPFDVSWFIVPFGCAQALPSAAVPVVVRRHSRMKYFSTFLSLLMFALCGCSKPEYPPAELSQRLATADRVVVTNNLLLALLLRERKSAGLPRLLRPQLTTSVPLLQCLIGMLTQVRHSGDGSSFFRRSAWANHWFFCRRQRPKLL